MLNVKEYQDNKLVDCGNKMVTIEHSDSYVHFLKVNLRMSNGYLRDYAGVPYTYFYEVNDVGLILCTSAPYKTSYIISTKGKCP